MRTVAIVGGALVGTLWLIGSIAFFAMHQPIPALLFLIAATGRGFGAWGAYKNQHQTLKSSLRSGLIVMGVCVLNLFTNDGIELRIYSLVMLVLQGIATYATWRLVEDQKFS